MRSNFHKRNCLNPKDEICLALDTALDACSVGLAMRDGTQVTQFNRSLELGRGHAEHLMDALEHCLAANNLTYQDLTRLAVTVGPGSFTGLRVGLATARALALALDIPLIGISTLSSLALSVQNQGYIGPLAVAIDARRNQIYGQLFEVGSDGPSLSPITQAEANTAEAFSQMCLRNHEDMAFVGSGSTLVTACDQRLDDAPVFDLTYPDMEPVALWALDQEIPHEAPAPLYLRSPDAKPQRSKAIARQLA